MSKKARHFLHIFGFSNLFNFNARMQEFLETLIFCCIEDPEVKKLCFFLSTLSNFELDKMKLQS